MKILVALLLVLAAALPLGATAQIPDELKIGDKTYFIHTNPLGRVLLERGDRLPEAESRSTASSAA